MISVSIMVSVLYIKWNQNWNKNILKSKLEFFKSTEIGIEICCYSNKRKILLNTLLIENLL